MSTDRRFSTSATLLALLACGCAHRAAVPHQTALRVVRSAGGVTPYIDASIAGHPIKLVVDTGARRSVLPIGFVRKFDVPFRTSEADARMVDANGSRVSMPRAFGLPVRFSGEATTEPIDFLVNPKDGSEEIGLLAPQELLQSGWAMVIDFPRGELRYEPELAALKRLHTTDAPLVGIDYHSCQLDNHRVAEVAINGVRSMMMLDTGSMHTVLTRDNKAVETLYGRPATQGTLVGVASTGVEFEVPGVPVRFASASFEVSALVVPVPRDCGTGLLGSDVLGECVMVWGADAMWASCQPRHTSQRSP